MRTTARAALVGLLTLALLAGGPAALSRPSAPLDRDAEDCAETLPVSYSPEILTGAGDEIALDVLVLTDGIDKATAERIVAQAAGSYAPLNVKLIPTFKNAQLTTPAAGGTPPTTSVTELIQKTKDLLGGTRPTGIDVVYTVTAADLTTPNGNSAAGYADCTGGVRYPTRAFAVGEGVRKPSSIGPFNFYVDDAGKIMAHEIGHLLGARHDYANCVEGIQLSDVTTSQPTPCTLMTAQTDLMSTNFGSLEKVVVRGHAEDFARP